MERRTIEIWLYDLGYHSLYLDEWEKALKDSGEQPFIQVRSTKGHQNKVYTFNKKYIIKTEITE